MVLLAIALALGQQTAGAAPGHDKLPSDRPAPDIVVTGRKLDTREAIHHLAAAITPRADQGVARFSDEVCPDVAGFPEARLNEIVARRIRDDAKAAGVAVGKPGCQVNLTVLVVPDGHAVVLEAERSHSELFEGVSDHDRKLLMKQTGPVRAWSNVAIKSRDGDRLSGPSPAAVSGVMSSPTLIVRDASIINLPTREDIAMSTVLLDIAALEGKTLNQIADYVAMRALAGARPPAADVPGDTILSLFTPDVAAPPRGLTAFDGAYLKAMYAGQATQPYLARIGTMATAIRKQVKGGR